MNTLMKIYLVALGATYDRAQYVGAMVVLVGLGVALYPSFKVEEEGKQTEKGPDQLMWAGLMVLSTVPDCLSRHVPPLCGAFILPMLAVVSAVG